MNKRKGFTLIELLVVIAIVAMLTAILLPALQLAKQKAASAVCMTRLGQWRMAFSMFANDNNGYLDAGKFNYAPTVSWGAIWVEKTWRYHKGSRNLLLCPSAKKNWLWYPAGTTPGMGPAYETDGPGEGDMSHAAWVLPTYYGLISPGDSSRWWTGWEYDLYGSYGKNGWCANPWELAHLEDFRDQGDNEDDHPLTTEYEARKWRSPSIKGSGDVPLLMDSWFYLAEPQWYENSSPPSIPDFEGDRGGNGNAVQLKRFCIDRHNGRVNTLFLDLSIKPVKITDLWKLRWHRNWNPDFQDQPVFTGNWLARFE